MNVPDDLEAAKQANVAEFLRQRSGVPEMTAACPQCGAPVTFERQGIGSIRTRYRAASAPPSLDVPEGMVRVYETGELLPDTRDAEGHPFRFTSHVAPPSLDVERLARALRQAMERPPGWWGNPQKSTEARAILAFQYLAQKVAAAYSEASAEPKDGG